MSDKDYIFKEDGTFIIKNYNKKFAFSNFLPGIAGLYGIPLWVFYVNRNQGIISFGIKDKDHSFLEFFPANKAFLLVESIGFRTFLKINGKVYEPFKISTFNREEEMRIRSSSFEIFERNLNLGLEITVKYFTLPNSPLGALIRKLSIKNISSSDINLEALDGLCKVIPFGTANLFLKDLSRTVEAWMRAYIKDNIAFFRLIVDPKDTSKTRYIEGANFNYSFLYDENKKVFPQLIIDPEIIFSYNLSFTSPVMFLNEKFTPQKKEVLMGKTPSSFSYFLCNIKPQEEKRFYSIFGASFKENIILDFIKNIDRDFIEKKEIENENLIEEIKNNAFCVSDINLFNHYISCSYLDNVLRGGFPFRFDTKEIYYVFSRKHGDLERDYNKFKLLPSYFSEGEANYRDINQNRRIDLFFNPFLYKKNVVYFLNFIKIDGYNPLVIKGEKLFLSKKDALNILEEFDIKKDDKIIKLLVDGFYLGEFFKYLKEIGILLKNPKEVADKLLKLSNKEPVANFGEGYWIDHWHYNLDLIENFLYFYPDKVKDLVLTPEYCFWDDEYKVVDRKKRYVLKDNEILQLNSVEADNLKKPLIDKRKRYKNFLRKKDNTIYKTNLIEKLLSLILNKIATFDLDGIGIDMEADKPGWCDSLNGLPAIFGSSVCETFQLKRACNLVLDLIDKLKEDIELSKEILSFLNSLDKLVSQYLSSKDKRRDFIFWDKANCIKEDFRKNTFFCISGKKEKVSFLKIKRFLENVIKKIDIGIKKAKIKGVYYTYFMREIKKYKVIRNGIKILDYNTKPLNIFLEANVDGLNVQKEKDIYFAIKNSELFDRELKMYRLNANLEKEPLTIGRSRIFPRGWLENESIWLHMEYKYLLATLKAGLYKEFYNDFYNCAVCFLKPEIYGRNPVENSSFIVSSANEDKNLWGKGFVARLSGSTVEILNIWMILCLGNRPFFVDENNKFCIKFSPILESKLFTKDKRVINFKNKEVILEENTFSFSLFSSILVTYHNPKRLDTFFSSSKIEKIVIKDNNESFVINSDIIQEPLSLKIREKKVDFIDIYLG